MSDPERDVEAEVIERLEKHNADGTFANHCASANILMLDHFASCVTQEMAWRLRRLDAIACEYNELLRKDREANLPVTREWWLDRFGEAPVYLTQAPVAIRSLSIAMAGENVFLGVTASGGERMQGVSFRMHAPTRSDIETLVRLFGGGV